MKARRNDKTSCNRFHDIGKKLPPEEKNTTEYEDVTGDDGNNLPPPEIPGWMLGVSQSNVKRDSGPNVPPEEKNDT